MNKEQWSPKFPNWLLELQDGQVSRDDQDRVILPVSVCQRSDALEHLVDSVFPEILKKHQVPGFFDNRSLVTPCERDIANLNALVDARLPRTPYWSADALLRPTASQEAAIMLEDLNAIRLPDVPDHQLNLYVGMPCVLMLNKPWPWKAGTVAIIVRLTRVLMEVKGVVGATRHETMFLPRAKFTSSDIGFVFTRKQFPVRPAYAVTPKSLTGRELDAVGLYIPSDISYNDLCTVCTRVSQTKDLQILIKDRQGPEDWHRVKVF